MVIVADEGLIAPERVVRANLPLVDSFGLFGQIMASIGRVSGIGEIFVLEGSCSRGPNCGEKTTCGSVLLLDGSETKRCLTGTATRDR